MGRIVAKRLMMNRNKQYNHGFSLVELIIAIGLGIFILATGYLTLSVLFKATTAFNLESKARRKLDSIAEQIRYQAVGEFDRMNEVNNPRTGTIDPQIEVRSTIGAINPATKSRPVTLVARYLIHRGKNYEVKTTTKTFELANTYARGLGGAVRVRFFKEGHPDIGVPNVRLITQGQGTPVVMGTSNMDGECVVYGVKVDVQNLVSTITAYALRAYFTHPHNTFSKYVTPINDQDITRVGYVVDYGEYGVVLPGKIQGQLVDNDAPPNLRGPVPNIEVRLVPHDGPVDVDGNPLVSTTYQTRTNNEGRYKFERVVAPGNYYILVVGNSSYSALDRPQTRFPDIREGYGDLLTSVNSDQVVTYNRNVIRKGSLTGTIRLMTSQPNSFVFDQSNYITAQGVNLHLWTNEAFSYYFPSDGDPTITNSWSDSLAADILINRNASYQSNEVTSAANGAISFNTSTPLILQNEYILRDQGHIIEPRNNPRLARAANALPVLVKSDGGNLRFIVRNVSWRDMTMPTNIDGQTIRNFFNERIYTNGTDNNPPKTFTLLHLSNNVLARARGRFDVGPEAASGSYFQTRRVETNWGVDGASMIGCGGVVITNSQVYVQEKLSINTEYHNGEYDKLYFDFYSAPFNLLLPNIGADTQRFTFVGDSNPVNHNCTFQGPVKAFTRTMYDSDGDGEDDSLIYDEINENQVDINDVVVRGDNLRGHVFNHPMSIVNGRIDFTEIAHAVTQWAGTTTPQHFRPGEDITLPPVSIPTGTTRLRNYYLTISTTAGSGQDWMFIPPTTEPGAPYIGNINTDIYVPRSTTTALNLVFMRRGKVKVRGVVRKASDNSLMPDVRVSVWGIGLGTVTTHTSNELGLEGTFDFTPGANDYLRFTLAPGPNNNGVNIWIRVEPGEGYISQQRSYVGFEPDMGDPMPDIAPPTDPIWRMDEAPPPDGRGGSG